MNGFHNMYLEMFVDSDLNVICNVVAELEQAWVAEQER